MSNKNIYVCVNCKVEIPVGNVPVGVTFTTSCGCDNPVHYPKDKVEKAMKKLNIKEL